MAFGRLFRWSSSGYGSARRRGSSRGARALPQGEVLAIPAEAFGANLDTEVDYEAMDAILTGNIQVMAASGEASGARLPLITSGGRPDQIVRGPQVGASSVPSGVIAIPSSIMPSDRGGPGREPSAPSPEPAPALDPGRISDPFPAAA